MMMMILSRQKHFQEDDTLPAECMKPFADANCTIEIRLGRALIQTG